MKASHPEPAYMSVRKLAERWNCSTSKVRSMIKQGTLPAMALAGMIRIRRTDVLAIEDRAQITIATAEHEDRQDKAEHERQKAMFRGIKLAMKTNDRSVFKERG